MDECMTFAEMIARYPAEWVVIRGPIEQPARGLVAGTVVHHARVRDEVIRNAEATYAGQAKGLVVMKLPPKKIIITRLWLPWLPRTRTILTSSD